jgi:hypothetical protein
MDFFDSADRLSFDRILLCRVLDLMERVEEAIGQRLTREAPQDTVASLEELQSHVVVFKPRQRMYTPTFQKAVNTVCLATALTSGHRDTLNTVKDTEKLQGETIGVQIFCTDKEEAGVNKINFTHVYSHITVNQLLFATTLFRDFPVKIENWFRACNVRDYAFLININLYSMSGSRR